MKMYYKKVIPSLFVLFLLFGIAALLACEEGDVTSAQDYEIVLDRTALSLDVGESTTLSASFLPDGVSGRDAAWSSSDASVATVDASGTVTAVGVGSAVVTAAYGDAFATCEVTSIAASISYRKNADKTVVLSCDETTFDGESVMYWHAVKAKRMELGGEYDLSHNDRLTFRVFSQNATGSTVMLRFSYADGYKGANNLPPYFIYSIVIDFTGWRTFSVSLGELKSNYSPTWEKISYISFECKGWNVKAPDPDTKLYFTDIVFEKNEYELEISGNRTEEEYLGDVRTSWKRLLAGGDGESVAYQKIRYEIQRRALKSWTNYQSTFVGTGKDAAGTLFELSPEMDYAGAYDVQSLYSHINRMALGYATEGTSCYRNGELLCAIKNSLEYAYVNYYGSQHITDSAYQQWVSESNWWNWEIGIPLHVVDILMLIGDELTQGEIEKYLVPVDYFVPCVNYSACNRVWVGKIRLGTAVLQNDALKALLTLDELYQVFDYVTTDDGFYTDGSFVQHNYHPYLGGYGVSLLEELTSLVAILDGTVLEMPPESIQNHYNWVFDSFEPLMYKSNLMACVKGREIARESGAEYATFTRVFASLVIMAQYAPDGVRDRLESLLKYFLINNDDSVITRDIPLCFIDYAVGLESDESITPREDCKIFKSFGNMDRAVQHREGYSVALSMSSSRIQKYEAINGDNQKGWYTGDGMIYIYTDGYDFDTAYFTEADAKKLPGTTVTSVERTEENLKNEIFGSSDFAGGVEHGEYGASAFVLGYEKNDYFNTDITAKKSYFMFDNEIVCLGGGIGESATGAEVYTTVENRRWREGDVFQVDGAIATGGSSKVTYAHFTNMGGYVFDGETEVAYAKRGSYLEMTVSHGVNARNGTYFFVYLPTATEEETKAYSASLTERLTVLAQTNAVHAVRDNDIGVTCYVFFEAGSCGDVTVSAPCQLMISDGEITASDPTHKLDALTVTVGDTSYVFDLSGREGSTCSALKN